LREPKNGGESGGVLNGLIRGQSASKKATQPAMKGSTVAIITKMMNNAQMAISQPRLTHAHSSRAIPYFP